LKKQITARTTALILLSAMLVALIPLPPAAAVSNYSTRTFYASRDTYIYQAYPTKNYDYAGFLAAGHSGVTDKRVRALIYFPITGIPSYAEIVSAQVVLHMRSKHNFQASYQRFWIFRLSRNWDEKTATWNKASSTAPWSHPGGDMAYDGPGTQGSYASFTVLSSDPQGKEYKVDVTELVRRYVNQGAPNRGIMLIGSTLNGTVHFYDRKTSNPSLRPRLVVVYQLPRITLTAQSYTASTKPGGSAEYHVYAHYVSVSKSTLKLILVQQPPQGVHVYAQTVAISNTMWNIKLRVAVPSTIAPGVYRFSLKVAATSKYGSKTISSPTITLRLAVASTGSFDAAFAPASVNLTPGGNATVQLSLTPRGYTGPVQLSLLQVPPGLHVTLGESTVNAGSSTGVTVSADSGAQPGSYTVVVKAKGGGVEKQATLNVFVEKPQPGPLNYTLTASPATLSLEEGGSGSIQVQVVKASGRDENVTLSLEGLPAGASYSFSENPARPGGAVTLTIRAGEGAGNYTLTIRARSSGGLEKTLTVKLHVSRAAKPMEFAVKATPQSIEINQGEEGSVQVQVARTGGDAEEVQLSVKGVPSGASATITPPRLTPPGSATLTVQAGSAKGTYTLLVEARSGSGHVETATVTLIVREKRCIVATATYGSELSPQVAFLRRFRDTRVLATYSGVRFYAAFNAFYYSWSPGFAQFMHEHPWTKPPMKIILYPLVLGLEAAYTASQPVLDANTEAGVYAAGAISAAIIGAVYLTPLALAALYLARRLGRNPDPARVAKTAAVAASLLLVACAVSASLRADAALTATTSSFLITIAAAGAFTAVAAARVLLGGARKILHGKTKQK